MTSEERREARYQRRKMKRLRNSKKRNDKIGDLYKIFSFDDLYRAGKTCCNGVRWKKSVQNFERHLFSVTAKSRKNILMGRWKPSPYWHFLLSERGKTRSIDAPKISDRQVHKILSQKALLPLYTPSMIYNNGACLPNKGFEFSKKQLKKDLCHHFRKYEQDGYIILMDFKQFFPSVPHEEIFKRHRRLIEQPQIRKISDLIVSSVQNEKGLPLGVESSQTEMIAFPSALDNYLKCQLSIKAMGHYMDDYYILVPPNSNAKDILSLAIEKAKEIGLTVNHEKTKILPLTKSFKYCKAKYILTQTGRIIVRGNKESMKRARRKIKIFHKKYLLEEMTLEDVYCSVNGMLAYFKKYNDHNRVLKLRRLFYALFGFSLENKKNFRKGD